MVFSIMMQKTLFFIAFLEQSAQRLSLDDLRLLADADADRSAEGLKHLRPPTVFICFFICFHMFFYVFICFFIIFLSYF